MRGCTADTRALPCRACFEKAASRPETEAATPLLLKGMLTDGCLP